MAEPPRPMSPVPVAAHGHQISAGRRTYLPPEPGGAASELEMVLASTSGGPAPEAIPALAAICRRYPAFLDGWARLGQARYLEGELATAYACARVGYHRGLDRLRRHGWGGSGEVRWEDPSNRGFLRALHLLMLCAAAIGESDEAERCRTFLLDLDPADGLSLGRRPALESGQLVERDELP